MRNGLAECKRNSKIIKKWLRSPNSFIAPSCFLSHLIYIAISKFHDNVDAFLFPFVIFVMMWNYIPETFFSPPSTNKSFCELNIFSFTSHLVKFSISSFTLKFFISSNIQKRSSSFVVKTDVYVKTCANRVSSQIFHFSLL